MKHIEAPSTSGDIAERSYTPLGLAALEQDERGISEYLRTIDAIYESLDNAKDVPENIRKYGEVALVASLNKQTSRNSIPAEADIPREAKLSRLEPDKLIELMLVTDCLRAVELARRTDIGNFDIDMDFHGPVMSRLLANVAIGTQLIDGQSEIKPVFDSSLNVLGIEHKQEVMSHFRGYMKTSLWTSMAIDLNDTKAAELFADHAYNIERDKLSLDPSTERKALHAHSIIAGIAPRIIAAKSQERFPYAYHYQTTMFEIIPERLAELGPDDRKNTPNLMIR